MSPTSAFQKVGLIDLCNNCLMGTGMAQRRTFTRREPAVRI